MERHSTLKKVLKQVTESENPITDKVVNEEIVFEPSQASIDLILNYSKTLSVQKSTQVGDVFTSLN